MHVPLKPFERLQVSSESLIDADRWRLAHAYHRNRQNLHFQALSQPGIVAGLGVIDIDAPAHISKSYRDDRWVQIQPGLAINYQGNPIVVPEPMPMRISSEARKSLIIDVFLTLAYVDPDQLEGMSEKEFVTETFRIHERQNSLAAEDIELCRIRVQAGATVLRAAENVFDPGLNEIDLRYRNYLTPQQQPALTVEVLETSETSKTETATLHQGLTALLKAQPGLYPALQAVLGSSAISSNISSKSPAGLICMSDRQAQRLSSETVQHLQQSVRQGSTLLIEVAIANTPVQSLLSARYQLTRALSELTDVDDQVSALRTPLTQAERDSLYPEITAELSAVEAQLQPLMTDLLAPAKPLLHQLNVQLRRWNDLSYNHPLKSEPFLFDELPVINSGAIELLQGAGVVVTFGSIFERWQLASSRSRAHRRAAQEMGVNLLCYACLRQQLIQLQTPLS